MRTHRKPARFVRASARIVVTAISQAATTATHSVPDDTGPTTTTAPAGVRA